MVGKLLAVRRELEAKLVEKALSSPEFRQLLMTDPRQAVEAAVGKGLPQGLQVRVIEETPDTLCVVVPAVPSDDALSDEQLEAVAGGIWTFLRTISGTFARSYTYREPTGNDATGVRG